MYRNKKGYDRLKSTLQELVNEFGYGDVFLALVSVRVDQDELGKLDLSVALYNRLRRSNISTVKDAIYIIQHYPHQEMPLYMMGNFYIQQLKDKLEEHGYLPRSVAE